MTDDVITFKRYVGAFNNVSRVAFGTDYENGEVGIANGFYYSLVAYDGRLISVNLSKNGDVNITVGPSDLNKSPQLFVEPTASTLEDDGVRNIVVQVAAEMADLLSIRELHLGNEYWTFISKKGIELPPGWDFTNSEGGEIHLERG